MVDEKIACREEAVEMHLLRCESDEQARVRIADCVAVEDEDPPGGGADEAQRSRRSGSSRRPAARLRTGGMLVAWISLA